MHDAFALVVKVKLGHVLVHASVAGVVTGPYYLHGELLLEALVLAPEQDLRLAHKATRLRNTALSLDGTGAHMASVKSDGR